MLTFVYVVTDTAVGIYLKREVGERNDGGNSRWHHFREVDIKECRFIGPTYYVDSNIFND